MCPSAVDRPTSLGPLMARPPWCSGVASTNEPPQDCTACSRSLTKPGYGHSCLSLFSYVISDCIQATNQDGAPVLRLNKTRPRVFNR